MSETRVFVRPAIAADWAGIAALAPRLSEGVALWRDQREARSVGRRWLEGSLDDATAGTGIVFVAVDEAAVDTAEAWARDRGLAHLTLHTGAYNASARAFYAALGFAEEEVRLTRPVPPA